MHGEILFGILPGGDVGRGRAADIDPRSPGNDLWTNAPIGLLDVHGTRIGEAPPLVNFAVWWDADPLRELLDSNWSGKWEWNNNASLRIYTATMPASNRLDTLMHDPQYRTGIAWQNVGYDQPPHPGVFLGDGMSSRPHPRISVRARAAK